MKKTKYIILQLMGVDEYGEPRELVEYVKVGDPINVKTNVPYPDEPFNSFKLFSYRLQEVEGYE